MIPISFGLAAVDSARMGNGPKGSVAIQEIRTAIQELNAPGVDPTVALDNYRDKLMSAQARLRLYLIDHPDSAPSIQRLAVVVWELGVADGTPDPGAVSTLAHIAATRAPRVPETQIELGELLYRTGQVAEGAQHFERAVSLAPPLARRAVESMTALGVTLPQIASVLPAIPSVLLSLESLYLKAGLDDEFLVLVDQALDASPEELLPLFGDLSLRTGRGAALLDRLSAPFDSQDPRMDALRLVQRARVMARLGDAKGALSEASRARSLRPTDATVLEALGEIAIESGDAPLALDALHNALSVLASAQESPLSRGRVYRKLGQAEELAGEPDKAFGSYGRAIRLNPDEQYARARLLQMETAAGLHR